MPEKETPKEIEEQAQPEKKEPTITDIKDIVSSDFLTAITRASGGFRIKVDQKLTPLDPMGMTDMKTKLIRLNPHAVAKFSREALECLLSHEAGHHAPEVVKLDRRMVADLARKDLVPEDLTDDPKQKAEILRALNGHLCNAELDCWLEAFMSRRPHRKTGRAIESLNTASPERTDLKVRKVTYIHPDGSEIKKETPIPLPDQLCQLLVGEDRYPGKTPLKDLVDPRVFKAYRELKRSGAIEALSDRHAFENYFASKLQLDGAIDRKFLAHQKAFVPAWMELFREELQDREEQ